MEIKHTEVDRIETDSGVYRVMEVDKDLRSLFSEEGKYFISVYNKTERPIERYIRTYIRLFHAIEDAKEGIYELIKENKL